MAKNLKYEILQIVFQYLKWGFKTSLSEYHVYSSFGLYVIDLQGNYRNVQLTEILLVPPKYVH